MASGKAGGGRPQLDLERGPLPPLEAEMAALGAVFRDPRCLAELAAVLDPGHFGEGAHQSVYRAMLSLWGAGKTVDLVTVAEELHQAAAGNPLRMVRHAYLVELQDAVATAAGVLHHASIVREHAMRRGLHLAGVEMVREAAIPSGPAEQALDKAQGRLFALAQRHYRGTTRPLADVAADLVDQLEQRRGQGKPAGLEVGIEDLDRLIIGLMDGELTLIAARPSVGKTGLAVALAYEVGIVQQQPVFFVSLEMSQSELAARFLVRHTAVEGHVLRRPDWLLDEHFAAFVEAVGAFRAGNIEIDDSPEQSAVRIAANVRRLKARRGLKLAIVDYVQLVAPEDRRLPRHEQVAGVSRAFKLLAKEAGIPVVVLAQLNRESEGRPSRKPRLSDLKDSSSLEQDADVVWLLHRPDDDRDSLEIDVAKNRNGRTDQVKVRFDRARMRFGPSSDPVVFG